MKKLTFLLALALLSGCVQERPWFYPANVSVKNNRVCISVPDDIDGNASWWASEFINRGPEGRRNGPRRLRRASSR
ncbi:putative T6SS immunity periplasmic lipoprotein [Serratia ureilytica]|uniref:putative T6SS immunity periplasmic lipoprotein n=1 Tax=Serratia ureilytica TaxID=300181 RepID=UPI003BAA2004